MTSYWRSYWHDLWSVLLWIEYLRGILGEWDRYSCASRSVAGTRLVEQENPGVCATVNFNWCKWETELYYLCISVIYEWVRNHLIINPIIRTRTRLISGVHITVYFTVMYNWICLQIILRLSLIGISDRSEGIGWVGQPHTCLPHLNFWS
jgi:hypothetical protein